MKRTILLASLALSINAFAQQATTASGGDASGSGGSAAYSLGQIVYTTHTGANGSAAQGVQQPHEISVVGLDESAIQLNLSVYPNPTTDWLTLKVENYDKNMSYQLYDISGKILENNEVVANSTIIKMEQLARATYFLKISQNNKEVKTFKIIKN